MTPIRVAMKLIAFILVFAAVGCISTDSSGRGFNNGDRQYDDALKVARLTLEAFNAQDGKKLASLVHPQKGVRFSPSAFVDVANDLVFSRAQTEAFWAEEKIYTWGFAEGTGDPINLTPSQYSRAYILSRDFIGSSSIGINSDRAVGNTRNNAALVYPNGTRVEYYIESSIRGGMTDLDWAVLRLVLERKGGAWYLVAVIHDEWAP